MLRTQQRRQKPTTIPENHNNLRLDSRRRQCPTISGSHAALRINFADSRAILNIFDTKAIATLPGKIQPFILEHLFSLLLTVH